MDHRVDPVVAQYRTVARREISAARDALVLGEDAAALHVVHECLTRVHEMATLLRHRRTTSQVGLLLTAAEAGIGLGSELWDRSLDALERLVLGGRPDPRLLEQLRASVDAPCLPVTH
ncbi:MAG: hypothetical protein P8N02_16345 [Actinomycetota bacterium]|jgi:hypothetical protein|nr:hypothetical protein [Actinomycetota bacterium]